MLTDYHVHLRPDDHDATPAEYFTAENARRYRQAAMQRGIAELGVSEHVHRFTASLDVWQHDWWKRNGIDDLDAYCGFVREETDLRLGIEADLVAGREEQMAALLDGRDWDYVVGSVHFLQDDAVDMRDSPWDIWRSADPDAVWDRYFRTLGCAAATGMFDILAHPDLVKVWGHGAPAPAGDLRRFYELAMPGIEQADIAIEVSTAGLRKPVGEIYPSPELLRMCLDLGKPVALSSDAHVPGDLGHGYDQAIELLRGLGVTEVAVFERRQRRMEPLG
ncbi:MAG: histidinol-phosphatase [Thermoleophilaceae bacterium]